MQRILFVLIFFISSSTFALNDKETLGKLIFFDTNLSEPAGQACETCHQNGLADPDKFLPVSAGVIPERTGIRNAPSAAYAAQNGTFGTVGPAQGGQFWDGRAFDLVDQAKRPFTNPVEMNNPDSNTVVSKVMAAPYAGLFEQVYGPNAFADSETAFNNIADAIAAFEMSTEMNKFNSKFDAVEAGTESFTAAEQRGRNLFSGRARCNFCHNVRSLVAVLGVPTNFSDELYRNLGLPRNNNIPKNMIDPSFIDLGLGVTTGNAQDLGKFKTPTLRNVELTAPYMHNGVFDTLEQVVHFYNARDVPGEFQEPEFSENVSTQIGNLGLSAQDEADIVAFLKTLTDR